MAQNRQKALEGLLKEEGWRLEWLQQPSAFLERLAVFSPFLCFVEQGLLSEYEWREMLFLAEEARLPIVVLLPEGVEIAGLAGGWDMLTLPTSREVLHHVLLSIEMRKEALSSKSHGVASLLDAGQVTQENALQSPLLWRRALDHIPDPICILDTSYNIVRMNKAMADALGMNAEDAIGQKCYACVHGKDRPLNICPHTRLLADGKPHMEEVDEPRLGGHFLVSTSPLNEPDGRQVGCIHIARDVTSLKQLEAARRRSESLLQIVLDTVPVRVFWKDRGQKYLGCNLPFALDVGLPHPDAIVGCSDAELPQRDFERLYVMWDRFLEQGEVMEEECCIEKEDGQQAWFIVTQRVLRTSSGKFEGVLGAYVDISHQKRAEYLRERLRQAQNLEMVGTLAGGVAHDFNNILFAARGFSELALSDVEEGGHVAICLQQELIALQRAADLVKQLLTFSQQQQGERAPLYLPPVMKGALSLLRGSVPLDVRLRRAISKDCGWIYAAAVEVQQIVLNLCTNGLRSMEQEGGILALSLKEVQLDEASAATAGVISGDYACIEVSDTGVGMNEETCSRVFEPYFTTQEMGEGVGLGLSMVHGLVASLGGGIVVDSRVNEGTVVRVFLPLFKEESVSDVQSFSDAPHAASHERVLLVDGDDQEMVYMRMVLEALGYKVRTEISAEEGLACFEQQPEYDVMVVGRRVHGMAIKRFIEVLRARDSQIPLVLCSTAGEENGLETTALKGAVTPYALACAIRRALNAGREKG